MFFLKRCIPNVLKNLSNNIQIKIKSKPKTLKKVKQVKVKILMLNLFKTIFKI